MSYFQDCGYRYPLQREVSSGDEKRTTSEAGKHRNGTKPKSITPGLVPPGVSARYGKAKGPSFVQVHIFVHEANPEPTDTDLFRLACFL